MEVENKDNSLDDNAGDIGSLIQSSEPLKNDDPYYDYRDKIRQNHIERTTHISEILDNYKNQQIDSSKLRREQRRVVLNALLTIIFCLLGLSVLLLASFAQKGEFELKQAITIVTSILALCGTILSIIHTIVKYLFPSDEDKNFNDLVVKIIEGDTAQLVNDKDFLTKKDEENK